MVLKEKCSSTPGSQSNAVAVHCNKHQSVDNMEWHAYLLLLAKLQKAKQDRSKLSQYVNSFEIQLIRKDLECEALRRENEELKHANDEMKRTIGHYGRH